ncbi:hypothetical protein DSECCO2_383230 [anaerobic digester metagenome]
MTLVSSPMTAMRMPLPVFCSVLVVESPMASRPPRAATPPTTPRAVPRPMPVDAAPMAAPLVAAAASAAAVGTVAATDGVAARDAADPASQMPPAPAPSRLEDSPIRLEPRP